MKGWAVRMMSKLVDYVDISPHKSVGRKHKIDTITIHHMAGNLTVKQCGRVFHERKASANYGIDSSGKIACYVDEKDRSWATSSASNDNRAITIEVANNNLKSWSVSKEAMDSLIKLLVDICKRHGIKALKWKNNKKLIGNVAVQNMTVHRWFKATACPGPYLMRKMSYIARKVNKQLK